MKIFFYKIMERAPLSVKVNAVAVAVALVSLSQAEAQLLIPIDNSSFTTGSGEMAGELTLLTGSSSMGPQQVGTSGWYGLANSTTATVIVPVAGIRPGITVNSAGAPGVASIDYDLGASLGGLAGLETPEATLWQPLVGQSLLANTTYTFSVDVNAGSLLDVSALSSRGFGIGLTTGSSATGIGTYFADSLSSPGLLDISLLSGTDQRLSLTFTTGASVPLGDLGVAIFAGRGNQALELSLLTNYTIDNAQLSAVPEPHVSILIGFGLLVILKGHRLARAFSSKREDALA